MKIIYYALGFFLFCFGVSWGIRFIIKSSTPDFLTEKVEELKSNKALMDSIGGYVTYEWTYNDNDYKRLDTVKYSVIFYGHNGQLVYRAVQLKESDKWKLLRDSLTIQ